MTRSSGEHNARAPRTKIWTRSSTIRPARAPRHKNKALPLERENQSARAKISPSQNLYTESTTRSSANKPARALPLERKQTRSSVKNTSAEVLQEHENTGSVQSPLERKQTRSSGLPKNSTTRDLKPRPNQPATNPPNTSYNSKMK